MSVLLIRITRDVNGDELYEQTRKCWRVSSSNAQDVQCVFSVYQNQVKEIYEVGQWYKCDGDANNGRRGFDGKVANSDFDKFRNLNISSLYQRGNANPIMYKNLDELETLLIPNITERNIMKIYQPLNQILYGPAGTGKTYNTINKAIEIIENKVLSHEELKDRKALKTKFEEYKKAGQIEFVTFHQSYGYEEFLEGIRAKTTDKGIEYEIENGMFKQLSKIALKNIEQ